MESIDQQEDAGEANNNGDDSSTEQNNVDDGASETELEIAEEDVDTKM